MMTSKEYIESGILEQYVLGTTSITEAKEVELMAAADPAIQQEIDTINETLERMAIETAIEPNLVIKPFLMATIDYFERIKNGEPVVDLPILNEHSKLEEYAFCLNRSDMISPGMEDIFAKIIGYTPAVTTAIVWLKDYTPPEIHTNEYERFLIAEGTCNITIGDKVYQLVPGDYLAIPLFENHFVKVTSATCCKIILQRVAA